MHPTALIGPGVDLGSGNVIGPYAVVLGPCTIGDENWIGPHVTIGTPGEMRGSPHVAAWDGEMRGQGTHIGHRNVIREFTTIQAPEFGRTSIGDDCYIMTKAHIPHDGHLGDGVTVACAVLIGGHGIIGDGANLGLGAVLHQQLVVGRGAMVGMGSVVTRSVPPHAMAFGSPARVKGVNRIGMQRRGYEDTTIDELDRLIMTNPDPTDAELPGGLADDWIWFRAALEEAASVH